jgi:hypothetical protein
MTQIMDSQVRLFCQDWGAGFIENGLSRPSSFLYVVDKSCRLANRPPRPLDIDERLALRTAEYKPTFRIKVHGLEQLESRTAQRHTVDATLLGVSAGLDPDALFQVEHVPRSAENFATAGACEQQQLDGICGDDFRVFIESARQRYEFCLAEISFPFLFGIALNSSCGVVLAPMPTDCEVERTTQDFDHAVGSDRRFANAGDVAMQFVDVVVGDVGDAMFSEAGQNDFVPH